MLDFHPNSDHWENEDKIHDPDAVPCIICGKGIREPWKYTIHIFYGFTLVTEEEARKLNGEGDMGAFPIGADCLKRHPEIKPYLIK